MPPLPRGDRQATSKKSTKKGPGDEYLEQQAQSALLDDANSIPSILYDTFFPRVPEEGFFGPLNLPYVTPQGAKNLRRYKYSGNDASLVYRYVLSPMAEMCVKVLPQFVAPNLITLVGLLLSIYSHIVIAYYSWNFRSQAPSWVWYQNSICLLLYQLLDNMDGKQARRTKTSSPLGMIFDHGCDSVNVGIMAINLIAMFELADHPEAAFLAFAGLICSFLVCTWEEFFLGTLELPMISGPSDGILLVVCLNLCFAVLGPEFGSAMNTEVRLQRFGLENCTWVSFAARSFFVCSVITMIRSVWRVVQALRPKSATPRGITMVPRVQRKRDAFGSILPAIYGATLTMILMHFPDKSLYRENPRVFLSLIGVIFSYLTIHLQLAHIQAMTYYPWRKTFIVPLVLLMCNAVLLHSGIHVIDPPLLLHICLLGAILSWAQFVFRVIVETSNALGVGVFTISTKKIK